MVNVGILGFAHGHAMMFGGEWVRNPDLGVRIVKGWDADPARADKCAGDLRAMRAESAEEILGDDDIRAVVITSETCYHADLVEKAAAAGKTIILYKPMSLTMADADRIVAAADKYGVPFTMGYQMRSDPQNIKIKQLIDENTIGGVFTFRRRHALPTHLWDNFDSTWHVTPALNRDIFADDASHPIDLLNWLFGVPESVMAEMSTMHNPKVVNENGSALFKYGNGMIAEISCCFTCSAAESTTEVYGANGAILQNYGDVPATRLPRPEGQPGLKWFVEGSDNWIASEIPSPPAHGVRISSQARPFAEFLRGERPSICTAQEGRDSLRMVLACYVSSRYGERVRIDDPRVYDV